MEERRRVQPSGGERLKLPDERNQHKDSTQSVDDGGDGRQQLGEIRERLAQHARRELGDEDGDAQGDRCGQEEGDDRGVERAPDERQRAELAGHRVPGRPFPERQAELLDGEQRLAGQLEADADDDEQHERGDGPRTGAEGAVVSGAPFHCTCTLPRACISLSITACGSGA